MSDSHGAEVIRLDSRRRGLGAGEAELRQRCREPRGDGSPCRLYLDSRGLCRVCQPERAIPDQPPALMSPPPQLDEEAMDDLERAVRSILGFVRRRLTGDFDVDDYGFDRELTEQVMMPLARPLYQQWWRVRAAGIGNIPDRGGALLVANHAGTIPFDALMTKLAVFDEHPHRRHVRELAADLALRAPVVGPLARKTGNTLAHSEDAVNLLGAGELVGVWPEGFKGIGKHYRDRYKLQRFGRGGFVEIAIRAGVPIVPIATIGSEEIYPIVANIKPLARVLGLPYFPVTWQFPLLGPLGLIPLPSKWVIEFGEPIHTEQYGPDAADDPMLVFEITDRVRDTIQQMIYRNLMGRRSLFF
ncbi:MAG TPA: lysophospholipid acyltransferase family protein [Euzebya sp.]|nr:lysophospholipid acyltransferase family protein [Euzebya sp.]